MAPWHSEQQRKIHEQAQKVRDELKRIEMLMTDVEMFAKDRLSALTKNFTETKSDEYRNQTRLSHRRVEEGR